MVDKSQDYFLPANYFLKKAVDNPDTGYAALSSELTVN